MLEDYKRAFKAYDIRGAYVKQIDERFSYIMGKVVAKILSPEKRLLIGSDVRIPNPSLISYFESGLKAGGFSNFSYAAFNYGICSTPLLYYLTQDDFDLGVCFTASHNPPSDVGMKFCDKNVALLSTDMLREMFKKEYEESNFELDEIHQEQVLRHTQDDVLKVKVNKLYEMLNDKRSGLKKRHHFVVDFSNGSAVSIEKKFFKDHLSKTHSIDFINDFPDGNFSAHLSETQEYENYEQLILAVQEKGSEFGLMFDGDADRIGIVGPDGKVIAGDLLTAMISRQILLEKNPDFKNIVLYETMSSKIIKEVVTHLGGEAKMVRVGRYFINQELKACGGIFAGECSGHFLFAEIGGYEMPLLALYYICKEIEEYSSWEELIGVYHKYFKSPVISLVVQDKEGTLKKIQDKYADYDVRFVDGVSVYASDFWFNVRSSNTADKIKFTVEADSEERMQELVKELELLL